MPLTRRTLLAAAFAQTPGYQSCTVIADRRLGKTFDSNPNLSRALFLPCSTFKIPNTLIGLETGVIPDENFVLPWDGVTRRFPAWNKDLNLREAIAASAVPYYQEVARRIGRDRMQTWLNRFGYGNRDISGPIDDFWLHGPLRITPLEQIAFLERLHKGELGIQPRNLTILKSIIRSEPAPGITMYSKTGWGFDLMPEVAWLVGWIEKDNQPSFFATIVTGTPSPKPLTQLRTELTLEHLRKLGLLPAADSR